MKIIFSIKNRTYKKFDFFGASQGIRTPDLSFRRRTLYPAELATHIFLFQFPLSLQSTAGESVTLIRPGKDFAERHFLAKV